jgi:hypothetical protein
MGRLDRPQSGRPPAFRIHPLFIRADRAGLSRSAATCGGTISDLKVADAVGGPCRRGLRDCAPNCHLRHCHSHHCHSHRSRCRTHAWYQLCNRVHPAEFIRPSSSGRAHPAVSLDMCRRAGSHRLHPPLSSLCAQAALPVAARTFWDRTVFACGGPMSVHLTSWVLKEASGLSPARNPAIAAARRSCPESRRQVPANNLQS